MFISKQYWVWTKLAPDFIFDIKEWIASGFDWWVYKSSAAPEKISLGDEILVPSDIFPVFNILISSISIKMNIYSLKHSVGGCKDKENAL